MLENRSFDQMLGFLYDGIKSPMIGQGDAVRMARNIEYVATITLCFIGAHAIARALYLRLAARKALMR
jgi:hypothetical protein